MRDNYSISEVADMFNITTNKIRFYEKKGLLLPMREINSEYRRFNEKDIIRLQSILLYRSIGLSIDSIKNMFNNSEKENCLNHFQNQWELVNNEIHKFNTIRKYLENVIDKLYEIDGSYGIEDELIEIISDSNEVNKVKSGWKDKWDFNSWAKSYDKDIIEDIGKLKIYTNYNLILQQVYDTVENVGIKDANILDIGVGTGNLSSKFLKNNYKIIGIDQSREMLAIAKQKHPNLKVRLGEFLKIPYDNNTFDVIVSTYAFHHLNESEKNIAIEEMIRVLKDDGLIVIGDLMFKNKEEELNILNELTKEQIEEIKDEYYSYIDILQTQFEYHNKKLSYDRVDKFNYIIKVI